MAELVGAGGGRTNRVIGRGYTHRLGQGSGPSQRGAGQQPRPVRLVYRGLAATFLQANRVAYQNIASIALAERIFIRDDALGGRLAADCSCDCLEQESFFGSTMSSLPDVTSVPSLSTAERATVLDLLFEPCTQLHDISVGLLQDNTFEDYNGLITAVGVQMSRLLASSDALDRERLDEILSAHPRLGEKKTGAQSSAEQAQLHTGGEEQVAKLAQCNQDYEKAFPGLRYV